MKKRKSIVVGVICALSLQLSCFAAQDKITVKVNGQAMDFKFNPITQKNNSSNANISKTTYKNTQKYSILYQALKNIGNEQFEGIIKSNELEKGGNRDSISTTKVANTIRMDKNENFEATTQQNKVTINREDNKESYKDDSTKKIIRLNDNIYTLKENNKWAEEELINMDEYRREFFKNYDFGFELEVFDKINIKEVNNKEYELDLNKVDSVMFNSHLMKRLGIDSSENSNIKQYTLKVSLNDKNEIKKIEINSKVEYNWDDFSDVEENNMEVTYDRTKVEIKKPNDIIKDTSIISLLKKGNEYYGDCEYKSAVNYFDKVVSMDSNLDVAYYNKSLALVRLEKYEEALACIDKYINLSPNDSKSYIVKGDILEELNKSEQALENYIKAIKLDPNCKYDIYYIVCDKLKAKYNDNSLFEKYSNIVDTNSSAYVYMGDSLYTEDKYSDSIKYYDKAISLNSNNAEAYISNAFAYYELKKYEDVIKNCDMVIDLNSKNKIFYLKGYCFLNDVYYLKAKCYAKLNNVSKVIENLKQAVEIDKNSLKDINQDESFECVRNTDTFKNAMQQLEKKACQIQEK